MSLHHLDTGGVVGGSATIACIIVAKVCAIIGAYELQDVSYSFGIAVAIETLLGSPVRKTFALLWKKLFKW